MADEQAEGVQTNTDAPEESKQSQETPGVKSLLDQDVPGDQPQGEGEGEKNPEQKPEEKPAGAPEKYEDFKLPDGSQVDKTFMESFSATAKEMNLDQAQAQKLVDLAIERDKRVESGQFDQAAKWAQEFESRADAKETLAYAAKAREFVTPGMREMLKDPRIGNNPDIIESMAKIGRMLAEDKFLERDSRGKVEKPLGNALFDDMLKSD